MGLSVYFEAEGKSPEGRAFPSPKAKSSASRCQAKPSGFAGGAIKWPSPQRVEPEAKRLGKRS